MKKTVHECLDEYTLLVKRLLNSVLTIGYMQHAKLGLSGNVAGDTPDSVMQLVIEQDRKLHSLLKQLRERQSFQRELDVLQDKIDEKNKAIGVLVEHLYEIDLEMSNALDEAKKQLHAFDLAQKNKVDPQVLVEYAVNVAWKTHEALPFDHVPLQVCPQPDIIKAGLLHHSHFGSGVSTADISKTPQPSITTPAITSPHITDTNISPTPAPTLLTSSFSMIDEETLEPEIRLPGETTTYTSPGSQPAWSSLLPSSESSFGLGPASQVPNQIQSQSPPVITPTPPNLDVPDPTATADADINWE
ncbi:hypothetical protein Pelo_10187 [Pelomyxa schiedti]|nr:hypothetical protein Pelo_10187 [Pelomyxa schiedti]